MIIPTHNRSKGLYQAIQSVFKQTTVPQEIVIVDDNSSENLETVINKFRKRESEIKIKYYRFSSSNGACAARNKGVELAGEDLIMFLDDDDVWEKNKVENQLDIIKANNDVGLVYSGRRLVKEEDPSLIIRDVLPEKRGMLYPDIFEKNYIGTTSSVAVKKELFEAVGGFDERLPAKQDHDLWIRVCKLTEIDYDLNATVRYAVSFEQGKQISNRAGTHEKAIIFMEKKYKKELKEQLSWVRRRKTKASWLFSIAKKHHSNKQYISSLKWTSKGLLYYPKIELLALLLPPSILNKIINKV